MSYSFSSSCQPTETPVTSQARNQIGEIVAIVIVGQCFQQYTHFKTISICECTQLELYDVLLDLLNNVQEMNVCMSLHSIIQTYWHMCM